MMDPWEDNFSRERRDRWWAVIKERERAALNEPRPVEFTLDAVVTAERRCPVCGTPLDEDDRSNKIHCSQTCALQTGAIRQLSRGRSAATSLGFLERPDERFV